MSVWHRLREVDLGRPDNGKTVVTVGNFDGVHRGHQVVIASAVQRAWTLGGRRDGHAPVVAVTFDPHPLSVLAPDRAPTPLTRIDRRVRLLQQAGADDVLVLGFDRVVAGWSPEEFVRRVLVDGLNAGAVVVGASFRFGARAAGTVDTLRTEGAVHGFTVDPVELAVDAHDTPWSSTSARAAIAAGDVAAAARVLGRDHAVDGAVVEGEHRGRTLGFPTANVPTSSAVVAVPADGVYAGTLRRLDEPAGASLPAAVSVGTNPTFDGVDRQVESYVLDRDDLELYGVAVEVTFHARLRGQVKFDGVDELVAQMRADVDQTRVALAGT